MPEEGFRVPSHYARWRRGSCLQLPVADMRRVRCVPRTARRRGCLRTSSARVGAVLRCGHAGDSRHSGALFGARPGAVAGSYGTGCRMRFCVLCGQRSRPPCLLQLLRPALLGSTSDQVRQPPSISCRRHALCRPRTLGSVGFNRSVQQGSPEAG
jgi:hypothetical protein